MPPKRKRGGTPNGYVAKKRKIATSARRKRNLRTAGFLGMERKFYDTGLALTTLSAPTGATGGEVDPATVNCISAPATGSGPSDRDGKKMIIKKAIVTGVIYTAPDVDQTIADNQGAAVVYLVLDKQTNGAQLNSEDVFTNPSAATATAATLLHNLEYSTRFQILSKTMVQLPQLPITYDGTNIEQAGVTIPFTLISTMDIPVTFIADTAGVSSVQDNSLHVIAFKNANTITSISYNARIRFIG